MKPGITKSVWAKNTGFTKPLSTTEISALLNGDRHCARCGVIAKRKIGRLFSCGDSRCNAFAADIVRTKAAK